MVSEVACNFSDRNREDYMNLSGLIGRCLKKPEQSSEVVDKDDEDR